MLTPTDLRIGNLIYDNSRIILSPLLVETIGKTHVELKHLSGEYDTWAETYEQLSGIPLTEEWLLKFGFEQQMAFNPVSPDDVPDNVKHLLNIKSNDWLKTKNLGVYHVNDNYYGLLINQKPFPKLIIQCVHQLQNLYYSLSGEELTIKP